MRIFEENNGKNNSIKISTKTFLKDEIIFEQGKKCNLLAYLKKGSVEAKTRYDDGSSTTVKIINEGEYIGINLIFSSNPIYKASFICLTDCELKLISKDDLLKLIKNDDAVLNDFLTNLSDVAVKQNDYLKMINIKTIKGKICYFLYQEYQRNNSLEFDIKYTKTALSKILHIQRPSLGFEIKNLTEEKVLENKNKHYKILSIEKLLRNIEK